MINKVYNYQFIVLYNNLILHNSMSNENSDIIVQPGMSDAESACITTFCNHFMSTNKKKIEINT